MYFQAVVETLGLSLSKPPAYRVQQVFQGASIYFDKALFCCDATMWEFQSMHFVAHSRLKGYTHTIYGVNMEILTLKNRICGGILLT
jgi:hypothetical protein